MLLFAGLLSLQNMVYFYSDEYSDGQPGVEVFVKGSAICTRTEFVPCPDCSPRDFSEDRFAAFFDIQSREILTFVLKNRCDGARVQQGMINLASVIFMAIGVLFVHLYMSRQALLFDKEEHTAHHYSIRIKNPPHNARDPEEWRKFFRESFDGARATVVTIVLENDELVQAARKRRECRRKIELEVEPGTSMSEANLAKLSERIEKSRGCFRRLLAKYWPFWPGGPGVPEMYKEMNGHNEKVLELTKRQYPVSNVFVSFETEKERKEVFEKLAVGKSVINSNQVHRISARHAFRGNLVLNVKKPDAPNAVRWGELHLTNMDRVKPLFLATICTTNILVIQTLLVRIILDHSAEGAAIMIAVLNTFFPLIAKKLTSFERHASEEDKSTSYYSKIALFRFINTSVIITFITPFTDTLSNHKGLISSVYKIFFTEIVTNIGVQFVDIVGNLKRHVLVPRCKTQDAMNNAMAGLPVDLAERATKITYLLFLTFWFSSLFPAAFFMCSAAFFVAFYADKFSLLRTWRHKDHATARISSFSRRYFFSTALMMFAIVSSYFWASFPFDNLCEDVIPIGNHYYGTHQLQGEDGTTISLNVVVGATGYRHCSQQLIGFKGWNFPALPQWQPEGDEWMSEQQELLVEIFGIVSVVFVVVVLAFMVLSVVYNKVSKLFCGVKHRGTLKGVPFSKADGIVGYIPQVNSSVYAVPLLACTGYDEDIMEWEDLDRPHSYYDLVEDTVELTNDISLRRSGKQFSLVSYDPSTKTNRNKGPRSRKFRQRYRRTFSS